MDCGNCGKDVQRLIDGLCGICDITVARRAPGLIGQEHDNQVDPDVYDPAKEMKLGMKALERHPDPRQRLTTAEARRLEKTLVKPAEAVQAARKDAGEAYTRHLEHNDLMVKTQEKEIALEAEQKKDKLIKLMRMATVVGPPQP